MRYIEQVCQSSWRRISTECLARVYSCRKYKNNENSDFKQDVENSRWQEKITWPSDGPHGGNVCMTACVCVWGGVFVHVYVNRFILKVQSVYVVFLCVCVCIPTNSINTKVRHTSVIKKQFGQRRGKCRHVCLKQTLVGPGVCCVFYIMGVTPSNTVH